MTIKLIDVRMMALRAAIKKEEQRLQDVADQVARISAGLDLELKSSSGIEEILTKLRNNLKKQSGNWTVMQQLAQQASADLHQKDEELAQKARGLNYSARQFVQSGLASTIGGKLVPNVAAPLLGLSALNKLGLTQSLGDLFDGVGSGFGDALQGVSLGELTQSGQLADGLSGVFQNIEVEDVLTAAGAGVAGVAGLAGLTSLLDGIGSSKIVPGVNAKVLNVDPTTAKAYETIDKFNDKFNDFESSVRDIYNSAAQHSAQSKDKNALDYVGDWLEDAGETVWDGVKWVGEKAVDTGEAVWDGMKWVGEKAADAGEAVWNGAKAVAQSKPVEYLWDMGGSIIGGGADILSFCGNVATLQWGDAVADGYSFINNFFDFAQDGSALFIYGMGTGADALGADDKTVDYFYDYAEGYSKREGLAGELHAEGLDEAGSVVDCLDWGVGTYKTVTGFNKLYSGEVFKEGQSWKEYLNTGFGWKTVDDLADSAEYADRIKYYSDLASNVDTGFKYADGFKEDGFSGLFGSIWDESSAGKLAEGGKESLSGLGKLFTWAADQN